MFRTLLFLSLIFSLKAQDSCTLFENTYISWNLGTDFVTFTFGKLPNQYWIAMGLNSNLTQTMQGANIYLFNGTSLNEYYGIGLEKPVFVKSLDFELVSDDPFWEKHISFQLPRNMSVFTDGMHRLLLAYNTEKEPISEVDFEKHTRAFYKDVNFLNMGMIMVCFV